MDILLFLDGVRVCLAGDDEEGRSREMDVGGQLRLRDGKLLIRKRLGGRLQHPGFVFNNDECDIEEAFINKTILISNKTIVLVYDGHSHQHRYETDMSKNTLRKTVGPVSRVLSSRGT